MRVQLVGGIRKILGSMGKRLDEVEDMTHEEKQQLEHVLEREKGPMTWGETQALVKAILEIHRVIYEKVAPPSDFSF